MKNQVAGYRHSSTVECDVSSLLSLYSNLRSSVLPFVFDDGTSRSLLCVQGTLPIVYRRAVYNVPVEFWLTHEYPNEPPLVYVRPTKSMVIKHGENVDRNGKVGHSILRDWTRNQSRGLVNVAQVLQMAFSNDPPVYSISSSSPVPTADPNHSSTGTPRQRVPEEIPLEPAKQAPHSPPHGQSAGYSPFKAMTFRDEVLDRVCRKFHSALSSTEARITEELSRARATNLQLSDNFNALQITMSNYMIRGDDLERRAIAVEKRRESMAAAVQALEKHQTDVERYAEGTRVAYEQLLNNVAEDLGIDDSIYQLGRAYEKQRVDTQTYLRMVRTLSRDQYFCREKIRRLLGVLASAAAATDPI